MQLVKLTHLLQGKQGIKENQARGRVSGKAEGTLGIINGNEYREYSLIRSIIYKGIGLLIF